jgi:hypothetical protein
MVWYLVVWFLFLVPFGAGVSPVPSSLYVLTVLWIVNYRARREYWRPQGYFRRGDSISREKTRPHRVPALEISTCPRLFYLPDWRSRNLQAVVCSALDGPKVLTQGVCFYGQEI